MPPLILVTNDDGIESPGLLASAEVAAGLGDLLIVAPRQQQSAMGHSYPITRDMGIVEELELTVNGNTVTGYGVSGSPGQAVLVGVVELAERPIDLCISGINYGLNVGQMLSASGTVGAALAAHGAGIPALAMSLVLSDVADGLHHKSLDWDAPQHFTRHFARQILDQGLPPEIAVLNVNVPQSATPETAIRLTTHSRQNIISLTIPAERDRSQPFMPGFEVVIDRDTLEETSDIKAAILDRVVSVTPLGWDWTADTDWGQDYRA